MKASTLLGTVLVLSLLYAVPSRAASAMVPLAWVMDYNTGATLYNMALQSIDTDPAEAVSMLTKAREYSKRSVMEGGSTYAIMLDSWIGKALLEAQAKLQSTPSKPKPKIRLTKPPELPQSNPFRNNSSPGLLVKRT
ncbi:MAG TPA: hypothetical protein VK815_03490 [Candidatus Acidoferrales bacterium]|nr:hypothetical protein [Candidatus Acidoferrales bacterium]